MTFEHPPASQAKKRALRVDTAALPVDEVGDDALQADSITASQLGVGPRAIYDWDRDPEMLELGWPAPPVLIRKRKYRPRKKLARFYRRLKKLHGEATSKV